MGTYVRLVSRVFDASLDFLAWLQEQSTEGSFPLLKKGQKVIVGGEEDMVFFIKEDITSIDQIFENLTPSTKETNPNPDYYGSTPWVEEGATDLPCTTSAEIVAYFSTLKDYNTGELKEPPVGGQRCWNYSTNSEWEYNAATKTWSDTADPIGTTESSITTGEEFDPTYDGTLSSKLTENAVVVGLGAMDNILFVDNERELAKILFDKAATAVGTKALLNKGQQIMVASPLNGGNNTMLYVREDVMSLDELYQTSANIEDEIPTTVKRKPTFVDKVIDPSVIHSSDVTLFFATERELGDYLTAKKTANAAIGVTEPLLKKGQQLIIEQTLLPNSDEVFYVKDDITDVSQLYAPFSTTQISRAASFPSKMVDPLLMTHDDVTLHFASEIEFGTWLKNRVAALTAAGVNTTVPALHKGQQVMIDSTVLYQAHETFYVKADVFSDTAVYENLTTPKRASTFDTYIIDPRTPEYGDIMRHFASEVEFAAWVKARDTRYTNLGILNKVPILDVGQQIIVQEPAVALSTVATGVSHGLAVVKKKIMRWTNVYSASSATACTRATTFGDYIVTFQGFDIQVTF